MNILFLSTEIPYPLNSGHHLRTYHTLKILSQRHDIYFCGFAKDNDWLETAHGIAPFCKSIDVFPIRANFKHPLFILELALNLFSRQPFMTQRYLKRLARRKIAELISTHDIDLVHFDMLHLSQYRQAIGELPRILVNHNVESLRLLRLTKVERNPLKRAYLAVQHKKLHALEKKVCRLFEKCVVVSDEDKRILQQMSGGDNFVCLPNGVDVEYFNTNGTASPTTDLVWVGSMQDPYNRDAIEYFVKDIFPLIHAAIPNCKVNLVGEQPAARLAKLIENYRSIRLVGYVDDVRPYVAQSSVFIGPFRCGSGTKIKLLNAMAQGKPVVATSVGAEGIAAKPNEEIVVADTPEDFAGKTVYLLRHPEQAQEMGRCARKVIESKYDWKVIAQDMNHLYEEIGQRTGLCQ